MASVLIVDDFGLVTLLFQKSKRRISLEKSTMVDAIVKSQDSDIHSKIPANRVFRFLIENLPPKTCLLAQ